MAVIDRVLKAVSRHRMIGAGERVIAAVSGGADSVCLVHVLREMRVNVAGVAHFNHKLRGEASEDDERFVASLAARLGLEFYRAEGRPGAGNLEQEARRDRRGFFRSLIRDGACERVALAHTRDDQAETVLFRVLRGSGLTGLAGIHPVSADGLIRPLLGVTRGEVREFLLARSIEWREDASNLDLRFARNRIRHMLLPQMAAEWNPRIVDALANLGDLAYEEEVWWAREGLTAPSGRGSGSGVEVGSMPRAIARRAVRRAIREVKGDLRGIEFGHVESVIEMDGRVRLPGVEFVRSADGVRAIPARVPELEVAVPGTYPAPDGASEIRLEPCVNLKADLSAPLLLRGWKPGDHYLRSGKSRDQKLKKMFEDARVPSWQRRFWPILEYRGKIVWAREFGSAEGSPVRVTETRRFV